MKRSWIACLILFCIAPLAMAQDEAATESSPAVEMSDAEQAFADKMSGAALTGFFSVDGRLNDTPREESYTLKSVRKVEGEKWIIEAAMTYKNVQVPIPVPVNVRWAGDTPMIQLTDLTIPFLGEGFTARVLFYGDRYAGTWSHGRVGGHLWGLTEKPSGDAEEDSPETETETR